MAAVELLIGQERWLHRDDFVAAFIEMVPAVGGGMAMAFVDWRRVAAQLGRGRLVCSSGEGHAEILREGLSYRADCRSSSW